MECGAEIPYDWAPCPQCGWKAPDVWEMEDDGPVPEKVRGHLSKDQRWIITTVWILLGLALMGLVFAAGRHF